MAAGYIKCKYALCDGIVHLSEIIYTFFPVLHLNVSRLSAVALDCFRSEYIF